MNFTIKENDTSPALRAILLDNEENPVNLSGASVDFHMTNYVGNEVVVNSTATVEEPAEGIVRYEWGAGDTADSGRYKAEFEVEFLDGKVETFPNDDYITVIVKDELA